MADKLTLHRRVLKARLWRQRSVEVVVLKRIMRRPICPWCDEPILAMDDSVMHEVFVKRGHLPRKTQGRIMVEENVCICDRDCHADEGQTRAFKEKCAAQLYSIYGRERVVAAIENMNLKVRVELP